MPTDDERSTANIEITTGARLHFGLLDTIAPFGGLGVMVTNPKTQISVSPADQFQCTGDGAERVFEIANRLKTSLGAS